MFRHARVVTGGDFAGAQRQRMLEESFKFDFRITQHIRIGRASRLVFAQEIIKYALFIFLGKINCFDLNADDFGDGEYVQKILLGWALRIVFPVAHKQADDFIALTFE